MEFLKKKRALICLVALLVFLTSCGTEKAGEKTSAEEGSQSVQSTSLEATGDLAQGPKAEEDQKAMEAALLEADKLTKGYFYDEAVEALKKSPWADNEKVLEKIEAISQAKKDLKEYTGQVYHVFFHSLAVYTDLTFDDYGNSAMDYNYWMTTQSEFKKMLPEFLKRNFVLYDIEELIRKKEDGTLEKKPIYLPEGKKPLIISQDDVNYYRYMEPDGFAKRLVLGEDGRVWTLIGRPGEELKNTRDGDIVPILDDFVEEHPEFSYRGAKGILAVTGYEGALGHFVNEDAETEEVREARRKDLKAVAEVLKKTGWRFASHSYTHNQWWRRAPIDIEKLKYDLGEWKKQIEPYVGPTNILITPFGVHLKADSPQMQLMNEYGFNIVCPVAFRMNSTYYPNVMIQDRFNLDGYTMLSHPERCSEFFDAKEILDPSRPPFGPLD